MKITEMMAELGDRFRLEGKPPPVIETDYDTAIGMIDIICKEIGEPRLIGSDFDRGIIGMYDGIAIRVVRL